MGSNVKRKQDRWWLADLLIGTAEILLYLPRVFIRIFKDIV